MRLTVVLLLLASAALLAFSGSASADSYTVGNCQKSGACAGVCVADADTACWRDGAACVGFSFQVPQCVPKPD
jgi:hypothetical protein